MNEDNPGAYVVSYTKILGTVALHDQIATTLNFETAKKVAEENLELNGKRWEDGILEISKRDKNLSFMNYVKRWRIKDGKIVETMV